MVPRMAGAVQGEGHHMSFLVSSGPTVFKEQDPEPRPLNLAT